MTVPPAVVVRKMSKNCGCSWLGTCPACIPTALGAAIAPLKPSCTPRLPRLRTLCHPSDAMFAISAIDGESPKLERMINPLSPPDFAAALTRHRFGLRPFDEPMILSTCALIASICSEFSAMI